jgi:hypothetical protein
MISRHPRACGWTWRVLQAIWQHRFGLVLRQGKKIIQPDNWLHVRFPPSDRTCAVRRLTTSTLEQWSTDRQSQIMRRGLRLPHQATECRKTKKRANSTARMIPVAGIFRNELMHLMAFSIGRQMPVRTHEILGRTI